ncbi:DUF6903 family protein [Amedibacillus sp. YH-ame10]
MNTITKNVLMVIIFIISIVLIFIGQKNVGYTGLMVELLGLAGILGILHTYNRRYK